MASQPEPANAAFPSVYQWEITDPAQGGAGGVANLPLKQLTERTKHTNDAVGALTAVVNQKAPVDSPNLTGSAGGMLRAHRRRPERSAAMYAQVMGTSTTSRTLSADEAGWGILEFVGALSAPVTVVVPGAGRWLFKNFCGQTITVKAAAGLTNEPWR